MRELTILVVDDRPEFADLHASFLKSEYDVRTATSGDEAIQKCDETVDVVLLDQRMPEMSGDEVLAKLRQQDFDGPVAMLSGVELKQDLADMPFDDYMLKPIERGDLLNLVDTLLKSNDD